MTTIHVQGMKCQHCAATVQKAIESLGAVQVQVDVVKGEVRFAGMIEPERLREAIAAQGFELVG